MLDITLAGRRALITGGSGGLGAAMAQAFTLAGASVAICGRDVERTSAVARSLSAKTGKTIHPIQLDLSDKSAAQRAVQEVAEVLGGLDTVVCAAGAPADGRLEQIAAHRWRESFEVKFFGAVDVMRESLAHLRQANGGVLIALSGLLGREPEPGNIVSGSINAALENFMKALAREVAGDGIRAVTICPGPFETPRIRNILVQKGKDTGKAYEDLLALAKNAVPLQRFGTPEEFARLAVVIASDASSFLTGTTITLDGGMLKGAF
ncbi:MAG TPA: SDR family oxidoreductase [Ramlibacter sp.]|nr:SDR family oxidoreductase [Ramlibacter sp.]